MTVRGKIHQAKAVHWGSLRLEITVAPETLENRDDIVIARWYAYRPYGIKEGCEIFLFGRVNRDKKGRWVMKQPEYEIVHHDSESYIHIDRIAPIYNLTEGLSQRVMRRIMFEATQRTVFQIARIFIPRRKTSCRARRRSALFISRNVGSGTTGAAAPGLR